MKKVPEVVRELALPVVEENGCKLWDVEYVREAGQWYLRLYIDKDGGVNILDCEAISRAMSDILDEKRPTRGDARRDAIVQAARKVCLEKGFSKITVSDIASEVGMTRSLFYHYFEDKEAVADAVLDNVIDEILTTLKQWHQARETGNVNKT